MKLKGKRSNAKRIKDNWVKNMTNKEKRYYARWHKPGMHIRNWRVRHPQ